MASRTLPAAAPVALAERPRAAPRAGAAREPLDAGRLAALYAAGVVVALPLPFGGWRLWASSLLTLSAGLALAAFALLVARRRGAVAVPFASYAVPALLFASVLAWAWLQSVSWTPAAWHHPMWRRLAEALGTPVAGAISLDPLQTRTVALELATYAALFWLALQAAARRELALLLARAVVASGVLYALYGLALYYAGSDTILWFQKTVHLNYVTATFENRNNFATFAGLALIACAGLLLDELARIAGEEGFASQSLLVRFEHLWRRGWALLVAAGVLATAILLSGSRGGMISILGGILALLLCLRRTRRFREVRLAWVFGATGAALALLLLLAGTSTLSRFDVDLLREEPRLPAWRVALEALRERPLLGSGLGAFEPQFMQFRTYQVEGRFAQAHSDVLENMVELGLPAALALDAVPLVLAIGCWVGAAARRRDAVFPAIGVGVTAQIALHGWTDFSLQVPAVVVSYAMLLAPGFAQSLRSDMLGQSGSRGSEPDGGAN